MNRQAGKKAKKKTTWNIPGLFLLLQTYRNKMNSPSSGWGSALPSGSTTESTCSCFCVSFEEIRPDSRLLPPPPPPLTSHKHTCLLLHPALNEVTGQFALLLPTRQRLKITRVRRNERMISACCLPLTFHVFPAWHHEYIAVYVLFLFFLNNIQHIKRKEKKSGGEWNVYARL